MLVQQVQDWQYKPSALLSSAVVSDVHVAVQSTMHLRTVSQSMSGVSAGVLRVNAQTQKGILACAGHFPLTWAAHNQQWSTRLDAHHCGEEVLCERLCDSYATRQPCCPDVQQ